MSLPCVLVGLGCTVVVDGDDGNNPADAGINRTIRDAPPLPPRDSGVVDDSGNVIPPDDAGVNPEDTGGNQTFDAGMNGGGGTDAMVVDMRSDECMGGASNVDVTIRVNDGDNASVQRDPGITTFALPFARSAQVDSLSGLVVLDQGGNRLPAQFESLSRYNNHPFACGNPIRHAFVHVRAVPAAGQNTTWRVVSMPNAGPEMSPMNIVQTLDAFEIDTGRAVFLIRRDRFEGLSRVEVGGNVISELDGAVGEGGFLLETNQVMSTGHNRPWRVDVERRGPQVATVVARGYYASRPGGRELGYTVRLYFYADSATVRVDHAYYHGEVDHSGADGATNQIQINGSIMRIPLNGAPDSIDIRATSTVHNLPAMAASEVEQTKRDPNNVPLRFRVVQGSMEMETGEAASQPFLSANYGRRRVVATISRLATRDPQAIRWDPNENSIDLAFTSSPMMVGGARGIFSSASIDFGATAGSADRGTQLQLHTERPLLATPSIEHINQSATFGPYAATTTRYQALYDTLDQIHNRTVAFLDEHKITGLQIWPDLERDTCSIGGVCTQNVYFAGGENNYWNWSKPGFDEFLRTGLNHYVYDFSLPAAKLFAETVAFRVDHDRNEDSSLTGMAPCYGDAFGFDGPYTEGLNQRRDRCPGDYTYNKHLKMAYVTTGDKRFVDFFEEAGVNAVSRFGNPAPVETDVFLEVTFARLSFQRLENVMNGAEFSLDPMVSQDMRGALRSYIDTMLQRVLLDGHACWTSGSGFNSALAFGLCESPQGWMMQSPIEFARRAQRFLDHQGLRAWMNAYIMRGAEQHTVLDGNGLPDISQEGADSPDNARNGWRTVYTCDANANGVINSTCVKLTDFEADGFFFSNGMMAYLNMYGLLLDNDPSDPQRICQWLPAAFSAQIPLVTADTTLSNDLIWGKASGQAFQMSPQAAGALVTHCNP